MRTFWKIILCISLAVLFSCLGFFGYQYFQNQKDDDIAEVYTKTTEATTEKLPPNPINFKKLKKTNKDIYSWIKIKNTNINYPILTTENKNDNNYYLRKNIYENYDNQGVIFTQDCNNTDWSDRVTVVYGHNIWTRGTMFYQLHKFRDEAFFKKNKNIVIYAPKRKLTYEIYSSFEYDDRHIMNAFDFSKDEDFITFINTTLYPVSLTKNVREGANFTTNDKMIVLSTCIKNKDNSRYLVVGKLIKDEKTK